MAPKRGLNKGRGLNTLIPQKLKVDSEASETGSSKLDNKTETADNKEKSNNAVQADHKAEQSSNGKISGKESAVKRDAEKKEPVEGDKIQVRIASVIPNQEQPRQEFEEESIKDLAESIRQFGVLQPLLVQQKGKYYEIIAGERRWRAAKEAGLKEIPVILRKFNEQEKMEIALIENIQREDLNPIEEAEAYKKLMDTFELTQEEIAGKVGKNRATVANSVRLLKLARPVRHLLTKGDISMGHARALLALEDQEKQVSTAHQIIQKKLSVRETEKLVKAILNPKKPRKKPDAPDEQIMLAFRELEKQLENKMGTKVAIQMHDAEKGKIEIEYTSHADLERILELIG